MKRTPRATARPTASFQAGLVLKLDLGALGWTMLVVWIMFPAESGVAPPSALDEELIAVPVVSLSGAWR